MKGKFVVLLIVGFVVAILAQTQAKSQTLGTLGTVGQIGNAETCPTNRGFLTTVSETCYPATLMGCPGNQDL